MTGWIAIGIVILLAIPFAFFGMEQYLFQSGANYAAKVEAPPSWWRSAPDLWPVRKLVWNSEIIETEDFRRAFEQERQQRRIQQGDAFDPRSFESIESRRQVLEGLIDQTVLRLTADSRGIAVGNAQVAAQIQQIPGFQVDGQFDLQRYQVADSAFVTQARIDRLLVLLGERRDVSFAVIPAPEPDAEEVGDEEINAWYQANSAEYRAPETVTIEYIEMQAAGLEIDDEPTDEELRAHFASERARFVGDEQRLASHILIEVPADASAEESQAAQAQARELAEQAAAPDADFAALAREHSADFGSAEMGGDLGWVQPGEMVAEFEQALFEMEPGDVSGPVRTDFGWHVLQLREVQGGGDTVAFEDVRDQLLEELSGSARERAYSDLVGTVVDQAYRDPNSLEPAAAIGGFEVKQAGPFARGEGEGVIANAAVQRAAFTESLIEDQTVSDPIDIAPNHSVLIRVTGHSPERARPLEEVRDEVIAAIRVDRATNRAIAQADGIIERMSQGTALSEVAEEEGLAVQEVPGVPRGTPVPHPAAVEAYFSAEAPAEGASTPGKVVLDDGHIVVFEVTAVNPGNPEDASAQERAMLAQQLEVGAGNDAAASLLRTLRQNMKVTVVESQL